MCPPKIYTCPRAYIEHIIYPRAYNVNNMIKITVAERIRELMKVEGISQYALAKELGISQSTICNWLNGKKEPSIESLWKIADFFGETIDYVVGRED